MKILVFVDPSSRGEWALSPAVDLARGLGATLLLLTTEEYHASDPGLLDRTAAKLADENLTIVRKTRPGSAREAILAESAETSPAITIFPPAGRGALGRMIKGSRVKTVLQNAPSTIMVARKPVSGQIRRILATVRGGAFSETVLLCAQEIADAIRAEVTVLHVESDVSIPCTEPQRRATDAVETPPLPETTKDISATIARLGVRAEVRGRQGMVISEILAECHTGRYDLLILGQHLAEKETGGPLSENLAQILAMESPIPVLMIRPRRWVSVSGSLPTPTGRP